LKYNTKIPEDGFRKHIGPRQEIPELNSRLKAMRSDENNLRSLHEDFATQEIDVPSNVLKQKIIKPNSLKKLTKVNKIIADEKTRLAKKSVKIKRDIENETIRTKSKAKIDLRGTVRNVPKIQEKQITKNDEFGYLEKLNTRKAIEKDHLKIPDSKQSWKLHEKFLIQKATKSDTKKIPLRLSSSYPNKV
jgi:hypothetical protein